MLTNPSLNTKIVHRRINSDNQNQVYMRNQQRLKRQGANQFASQRLAARVQTQNDDSISEEPELQDYQQQFSSSSMILQQTRSQLSRSYSHTYQQQKQQEDEVADIDIDDREYEQFTHQRRNSGASQTNLSMCRPNQVVDVNCAMMFSPKFFEEQVWERIDQGSNERLDSERPSPRQSCSWVLFEDSLYVFGGFSFSGRLNDLCQFDFCSQAWAKLASHGQRPSPRENNGAVLYRGQMYIFGGYDGQSWLNDFYCLNLTSMRWSKFDKAGEWPSERFGFASGVWEDKMLLFGGFDGNTQLNDAFLWDFGDRKWQKVELQGDVPAPRSCPCCVVFGNHFYVFGGFDGINRLNDFYKFNFQSGKVSRISQHGQIPCPRYVTHMQFLNNPLFNQFHCASSYQNKMVLFGGYNGHVRLNDLYEFDFNSKTWTRVDAQDPPQGRSSMLLQIYNDCLYTFGGYNGFDVLNDLHRMPFRNALVPKSTFLADLESLINNKELSDVVFLVEGREVHANKSLLAVRSQHFRMLLFEGFRESNCFQKQLIEMPGVTFQAFTDMLKFLYTDQIDPSFTLNRLVNLIQLADQYLIERLKFLCEERVNKLINMNNVIDLLIVANKFNSNILKQQCMKVVTENIGLLKKKREFQKLMSEPEILMDIIQKKC